MSDADILAGLRAMIVTVVRDEIKRTTQPTITEHITVADYARRLSISQRAVRDAIRDHRLEHIRIGRAVRIPTGARIEPRTAPATARARLILLGGKR